MHLSKLLLFSCVSLVSATALPEDSLDVNLGSLEAGLAPANATIAHQSTFQSPLRLLARANCPAGYGTCPDGLCYPSTAHCCAQGSACAADKACCGPGCMNAGNICCNTKGDNCNKGGSCYIYNSQQVCCTDSSCTAYVDNSGQTVTRTRSFTYAYSVTWYSYYYSVRILASTQYTYYTTFTIYAIEAASATAQLVSLTASVKASLTDPSHTRPSTTPAEAGTTQQATTAPRTPITTDSPLPTGGILSSTGAAPGGAVDGGSGGSGDSLSAPSPTTTPTSSSTTSTTRSAASSAVGSTSTIPIGSGGASAASTNTRPIFAAASAVVALLLAVIIML